MASDDVISDMDLEDEEKLDSIVDEFFSFIEDDFHQVSDEEIPSFSSGINDVDSKGTDPYTLYMDHLSDNIDLDNVLDEHFSFLQDEPTLGDEYEEFYSLDQAQQPPTLSTRPSNTTPKSSNHTKPRKRPSVSRKDEQTNYENMQPSSTTPPWTEPIYSNVADVLSQSYSDLAPSEDAVADIPDSSNEENLYEDVCLHIDDSKALDTVTPSKHEAINIIGGSTPLNCDENNVYHNTTGVVINIPVNVAPSDDVASSSPTKSNERKSSVYLNPDDSLFDDPQCNETTLSDVTVTSVSASPPKVIPDDDCPQGEVPVWSGAERSDSEARVADASSGAPERKGTLKREDRENTFPAEKRGSLERDSQAPEYSHRFSLRPPLTSSLEALNGKWNEKENQSWEKRGDKRRKDLNEEGSEMKAWEGPTSKSDQPKRRRQREVLGNEDSGESSSPSGPFESTSAVGRSSPDPLYPDPPARDNANSVVNNIASAANSTNPELDLLKQESKSEEDPRLKGYPASPGLEKDLETLHSLDLEMEQLEGLEQAPGASEGKSLSSLSDLMAEAINSNLLSSDDSSLFTFPSNLTLNTEAPPVDQGTLDSNHSFASEVPEDARSRGAPRSDKPGGALRRTESLSLSYEQNYPRFFPSLDNVQSRLEAEGSTPHSPDRCSSTEHPLTSSPAPTPPPQNEDEARGVSAAISGVIRRSMRRMRHIRLSGKKSKRKGHVSEETEFRRQFPVAPEVGLPSLRSPTSSAVLLPSLLAALAPTDRPRESLPSPDQVFATPGFDHRRDSSENSTALASQRSRGVTPERGESINGETGGRGNPPLATPSSEVSIISSGRLLSNETLVSRVSSGGSDNAVPASANPPSVPVHGRSSNARNVVSGANNLNNNSRENRPPRVRPRNINNNNNNSNNNNNNNNVITNTNATRSPSRATSTSSRLSSTIGSLSSGLSLRRDSLLVNQATSQRSRGGSVGGFLPPKRLLWPHGHSGLFASLAVTLNMFNISRFAVLGAEFGWQFPIQWFIISLVIGLPLMTFHSAVGQTIGGSVIDMWTISPIFQGVGMGLLLVEGLLGIYCCVPVAWLFTYFRDSFDMRRFRCMIDCGLPHNLSKEINTYVPRYFSKDVLQRSDDSSSLINTIGAIKFDLSFNIALIWVITFLALSRGVRSYGKVCYLVIILPLFSYLAVAFYLVYWNNSEITIDQFRDIFIDRHSWMAASREAFLVWGLHGAVFQQMAASNRKRHSLWKDTSVIAIVTMIGLGLASVCGIVFASVMQEKELAYVPSSFETGETRAFVRVNSMYDSLEEDQPERRQTLGPPRFLKPDPVYDNFYVGIRVREEFLGMSRRKHQAIRSERSGYNSIRFLTEMFPALLFAKDRQILGVWPPLFYLSLLLFGMAHQLAVWHTVVQGLIRINYRYLVPWETFITFCTCLFGFSSSLLMATGLGIQILYFLDYVVGCVWWVMILQLIMVFAVLFVRGKPYTAQAIAKNMFGMWKCCSTSWITAPMAFSWTIMVPVGLLVLSISSFKTGNYREVFAWESKYWSTWTCQVASVLQLFPLFLVPLVGLIQTLRYLASPTRDWFERIQHLYRPPPFRGFDNDYDDDAFLTRSRDDLEDDEALHLPYVGGDDAIDGRGQNTSPRPFSDPPPKYTPPPSYSTATGSGFYKFFNHSFRRSVRRLRNTLLASTAERQDLEASSTNPNGGTGEPYIPPPDYTQPSLRGGHSPAPPQYATLDPIRIQRALRRFQSTKTEDVSRMQSLSTNPAGSSSSGAGSSTNIRGTRSSATSDSTIFSLRSPSSSLALSRSFSRTNSQRRSSRLRRSLTSSLRRNARRLALNLTTGISGDAGDRWGPSGDSTVLVGDRAGRNPVPVRSLSNVELSTQSEA